MRRALVIAVAIPALALSACSSDNENAPSDDAGATSATQAPGDDSAMTSDTAAQTDMTMTTATSAPRGDTAQSTGDSAQATGGPDADVEGGAEGQAAADVTKEFITALTEGDPSMCNYMADLQGKGTGPLKDDEELLKICEQTIPSQTEGEITDEEAAILGAMEITGADVQGDTAKVDKDNFSDLFAAGFGDQVFVLKKYNGDWFIDLGLSQLSPPDKPAEG